VERAVIEGMDDIYEAWHRKLGHAEYRITITMSGYGRDEDAADALLGGFLEKHPEAGPVVSQDRDADTIAVTFSLQASSQDHALRLGQVVWGDGGAASGLAPPSVVRVEIEPVQESSGEHSDRSGERIPA
jgi:hypothetical protein